ncbi:MAG: hypothetical protein HQK83_11025 [Fibrobacteria bacterium]|nr:hypothetical protein [Fibrobacteria bacterium]
MRVFCIIVLFLGTIFLWADQEPVLQADSLLIHSIQEGYLGAEFKNSNLIQGVPYRLEAVEIIDIQSRLPEPLIFANYTGKPASLKYVQEIIHSTRDFFLQRGFPFAVISPELVEAKSNSFGVKQVKLVLRVTCGSGYKLGALQFYGTKTRNHVLSRMSLLTTGETYNEKRLELSRKKLARSGYFRSVEWIRLSRDSARNLLYPAFTLEDLKANSISGLLGYNSEDRQKGFTGFLDILLNNIMGTARDFSFHFLSNEKEKQAELDYKEPWLWHLPFGGGFRFSLSLEDSIYNETEWGVTLFQDMGFYSKYLLSFSFQDNEMYQKTGNGITIRKSSAAMTGIELLVDWRNAFPFTESGGKARIGLNGIRRSNSDTNTYLIQHQSEVDYWIPLPGRFILHQKLTQAAVWPLGAAIGNRGNLFQTGGTNSIRGFREHAFLTNIYFYGNFELQYLLSNANRVMLFIDPALINRLKDRIHWQRVAGYGLWTELGNKDWVFGIGYALSSERKLSEGLLHVKVINQF